MTRQDTRENQPKVSWQIDGLAASRPHPGLEKKLALFGQFVGDWDIVEARLLQKDGSWSKGQGALYWRWILEGRGVQDIFASIDPRTGKEIPVGTTVRFYDSKIRAWRSTWNSPRQGAVRTFIGREVGDEIVLEEQNPEGRREKWFFYEILRDSFRWRSEFTNDGGKTYVLDETMQMRRRSQKRLVALSAEAYPRAGVR